MNPTEYINIENIKIAIYQNKLEGQPVLFIHGNSLSAETFTNQLNSSLLNKFRLIAIDLPGHGYSPKPTEPERVYQVPFLLKIISEVISKLNLIKAVIVGNSFGGHLATEMLTLDPKIAGIFIFGTPALGKPPRMAEAFLPEPAAAYFFKPEALTEEEIEQLTQTILAQPAAKEPSEIVRKALRVSDNNIRGAIGNIIASGNYHNEEEILKRATVPVALVQGQKEKFISLSYLQQLTVANLWQETVHIIPNAGHCPQLEQPEAFNKLLAEFIMEISK